MIEQGIGGQGLGGIGVKIRLAFGIGLSYFGSVDLSSLHADAEWQFLRTLLPADLDATAYQTGALKRCRNIENAESLVRIALAYAVSDLSLKDVAAWSQAMGQ